MPATLPDELPERQRLCLTAIKIYISEKNFPPTARELATQLNVTTSSVRQYLDALERKGYIKRPVNGGPRTITVLR